MQFVLDGDGDAVGLSACEELAHQRQCTSGYRRSNSQATLSNARSCRDCAPAIAIQRKSAHEPLICQAPDAEKSIEPRGRPIQT